MKFENYSFQNIYVITTYKCNWNCKFCLFKYNTEQDANEKIIIDRIKYSIENSPKKVYIKITGGEPFLKPKLLEMIFELAEKYKEKVYKIGIGTNGSIHLSKFFNNITIPTHIFLSRHQICNRFLTPEELKNGIDNNIVDFRLNCNLIKGFTDNVNKIEKHVNYYKNQGINHFCFRELSKVSIDHNYMYPKQIYNYIKYYDKNLIKVIDIENELINNIAFRKSRITGNYYDQNNWYWYKDKISIKFRTIDETKLIDFNMNTDEIDEYVVHPDGTLTGCWDKELKVIMKGGE